MLWQAHHRRLHFDMWHPILQLHETQIVLLPPKPSTHPQRPRQSWKAARQYLIFWFFIASNPHFFDYNLAHLILILETTKYIISPNQNFPTTVFLRSSTSEFISNSRTTPTRAHSSTSSPSSCTCWMFWTDNFSPSSNISFCATQTGHPFDLRC